jgi:prepilin-type N-terminal cleavage/methylation domain-containing protein
MVRGLKKSAFTLIELIFAIVVMSIVVMSLPIMMQTTSKAIEDSIVQEAIFAASAELMGASAYYWDTRSIEDINVSGGERVIDVDGNCNTDRLRLGHVAQPYHRRCLESTATNIDPYSYVAGESLNSAVRSTIDAMLEDDSGTPTAEAAGYKQIYRRAMSITQGTNNNIKILTANIYEDDGTTLLTSLKIYSANIGEVEYYKRSF